MKSSTLIDFYYFQRMNEWIEKENFYLCKVLCIRYDALG